MPILLSFLGLQLLTLAAWSPGSTSCEEHDVDAEFPGDPIGRAWLPRSAYNLHCPLAWSAFTVSSAEVDEPRRRDRDQSSDQLSAVGDVDDDESLAPASSARPGSGSPPRGPPRWHPSVRPVRLSERALSRARRPLGAHAVRCS